MTNLPMLGHTHGNRSAVTCHLKCDSQCSRPDPNPSTEPTFAEIAGRQLSRRALLAGRGTLAAAAALPVVLARAGGRRPEARRRAARSPSPGSTRCPRRPTSWPYRRATGGRRSCAGVTRCSRAPPRSTRTRRRQGAGAAVRLQQRLPRHPGRPAWSYGNAVLQPRVHEPADHVPADHRRRRGGRGAAHADRRTRLQHRRASAGPGGSRGATSAAAAATAGSRQHPVPADRTGRGQSPAADRRRPDRATGGRHVRQLLGRHHAVGHDPVRRGELPGLLPGRPAPRGSNATASRTRPSVYGWEKIDPRFDATAPATRTSRTGSAGSSRSTRRPVLPRPRKHTAMGRFKHEGANVGRPARPVARVHGRRRAVRLPLQVRGRRNASGRARARARRHNLTLLTEGDLYVARFTGDSPAAEINGTGALPSDGAFDGTGEWIPLVLGGVSHVPGMSVEEVLVFTRLAADRSAPRRWTAARTSSRTRPPAGLRGLHQQHRPRRTPARRARTSQPAQRQQDGHVIEITEDGDDAGATSFSWNILLLCGDPATTGRPTSPASGRPGRPDLLPGQRRLRLARATCGCPPTAHPAPRQADGLFKVPLEGAERGHVQQFLAVPRDAETCGPVIHDDRRLGVRGRPAPGRGRHLGRAPVLLPGLRRRRTEAGPWGLARTATDGGAGDEEALTSITLVWPVGRRAGGRGSGARRSFFASTASRSL